MKKGKVYLEARVQRLRDIKHLHVDTEAWLSKRQLPLADGLAGSTGELVNEDL